MRTTVSLDDDILPAVKERARRENRSMGALLSDLARQASTAPHAAQGEPEESFYGFDPLPPRGGFQRDHRPHPRRRKPVKRALLDVNVLLALLDRDHIDHSRAREWFTAEVSSGWASCAITENGFVRILSQPHYPNPTTVSQAAELLARAAPGRGHEFLHRRMAARTQAWFTEQRRVEPH